MSATINGHQFGVLYGYPVPEEVRQARESEKGWGRGRVYDADETVQLRATQPRDETSSEKVFHFQDAILRGEEMPPVEVARRDDGSHWLLDGHHRTQAMRALGVPIKMRVRDA